MPRPALDLGTKCCQRCGKVMRRTRYGNQLEDAAVFRKRRFCSRHCANSRGNWGRSSTARHREAQKSVKPVCEKCNTPHRRLHVHHRDGDYQNNALDNLQTLCPSCHKREHLNLSMGSR